MGSLSPVVNPHPIPSSQAKKGLKLEGKDMHTLFATPELANEQVKLKGFAKFEDTTEALASATAAVEGKLSKGLKKFIKSSIVRDFDTSFPAPHTPTDVR